MAAGRTIDVDEDGNVLSVGHDGMRHADVRARLQWLAWLLDSSIPVPGTRFTVGIDGVVGMFPVAGELFDAAWKANQKNVRLLDAWLERPRAAERSSRLFGAALVAGVALFLVLLGAAAVALLRALAGLF